MSIQCIGLNFRTAGIDVREKLAFSSVSVGNDALVLREQLGCNGVVILSTCNRTELYFSSDFQVESQDFEAFLEKKSGAKLNWKSFLEYRHGEDACQHLFRVVSGLESMVLGETEIFGQVKNAYSKALESGATDGILNKLFQTAFRVGKKVRTETEITHGATSVGSVAVELAERIFGDLKQTRVLILGAGEMSRVTAQSLKSRGASGIFVANRSHDRAIKLAEEMGGKAVKFSEWIDYLIDIDIVIASTASPHHVVSRAEIEAIRKKRKYRSLFMIDIALPRDIAPDCAEIDEVYLYDLDTLQELANEGRVRRQREVEQCERIITNMMIDCGEVCFLK